MCCCVSREFSGLSINSPGWTFDETTFERSAAAFDNSDYVDVVIHSYRHRMGLAEGFPRYAEIERRLAALPVIEVPTITLDGEADGVVPATDGRSSAAHFTHRHPRGARRRSQSAAGSTGGIRGCGVGTGVNSQECASWGVSD